MIRSATSKKFITYNPDAASSLAVQGQVTNTAPGSITLKVPRALMGSPSNGARLVSVTGYTFSERGPLVPMTGGQPSPTNLPIQIDASGAATYVAGEGPQLDGVVEVSIDDASFAAARIATLLNITTENRWLVQLGPADLIPGSHTLYTRQRINGREPSPISSVQFTVSQTIEQTINSLVSLQTSNPSFSAGVASYNLSLTNTSSQSIFSPLRIEVAAISGGATVANADNNLAGAGALWDFSSRIGSDSILSPTETSSPRTLRFNDAGGGPFSVTFNVIGNQARTSNGAGSSASSTTGSGESSESGSSGTSSVTGTVTAAVFTVTYNPLLNTATVQLLKP